MSVKLMKNLQFADKLHAVEAITEAGKELLNNYRAYVYNNVPTCSVVNNFVAEASKYTFDAGLSSIVESINEFINKNNISWKLSTACESINNNNSQFNYINRIGVQQVEKLLEMNENDVVSYIKAGSLKSIQYIPEFRQICKEVYRENITETKAPNYTVTNPISYVAVEENAQYFNVLGKTYKIEEGKVNEAHYDDPKFVRVNALLESFTRDGEKIFFEYKSAHGSNVRYTIDENGLTFESGNVNEHFDNSTNYLEYINMVSRTVPMNEKFKFIEISNAVNEVFESMQNVVLLDCAKVLNASNGTVCAIIEANNNVNLTVFRSVNAGTSCNNYDYVVEALNNVIKISGIDLKPMFEDRINEDFKKQDPEAKEIREQLEANKDAQFAIRKKKIAMLAEQYKNDPVRIALLNKVAKDLNMLESRV